MKKKIAFIAMFSMLIIGSSSAIAQNKEARHTKKERPSREKIIEMKTNLMVNELMLDDKTTAKFKPLYQKYLSDMFDTHMGNRKEKSETRKDQAEMSNDEIAKLLKSRFAQSRKLLNIKEKSYANFSKILSQKQIMRMYEKEKKDNDKFRNELSKRHKQHRKAGKGHQHPTTPAQN